MWLKCLMLKIGLLETQDNLKFWKKIGWLKRAQNVLKSVLNLGWIMLNCFINEIFGSIGFV